MKKNKIIITLFLAGIFTMGTFTSCKKDFLDINQNPNSPADAGVKELLPSAEAAIAHVVGNNFQIYGGLWAQHWTQSPSSSQYKTFEQYSPSADDFDRPWQILYSSALKDLQTIIAKAPIEQKPNYGACAFILQAYTYQLLTDNFGDIPFSEALKGEAGLLSPHYDSQKKVYDGIISLIDQGLAILDPSSDVTPGTDDLLLGGDMFLWQEFAYTLKLRVYLRLSEVDPAKAQAGVAELEAIGAVFLGPSEEVKINYFATGGNSNPLYSSMVGLTFVQNLVASATAINYLNDNLDPRVDAFYVPASNGSQVGLAQGDYTAPAGTPVSLPSALVGGDANDETSALAPVKLMTGYESMFLQAEAIARGWMTIGDDQVMYESAIADNFESYGFAAGDAALYVTQDSIAYPATGTVQQKVRAIITQKWIAMCGNQNDEAWIEQRRTGYPDFFSQSATTIIGAGRFPGRFYYPSSEGNTNSNFPGQPLIYSKVWWDVN